jgi:hypothetical protein
MDAPRVIKMIGTLCRSVKKISGGFEVILRCGGGESPIERFLQKFCVPAFAEAHFAPRSHEILHFSVF